ncbi:MAG TPA: radical SAM protein [Smithellaceae bacterium]|nr:radical SAM protein [Smithellaceae bacterium]
MYNYFEQGPIRPPSEAQSLLIRVTRNCPWNKCAFCHTYTGSKFELRSVDDVKKDIRAMKAIADQIVQSSRDMGEQGEVNRNALKHLYNNGVLYDECFYNISAWLYFGGESAFLQDANSLIVKTADLVEILTFLREQFPQIKRITSYCRSHTAARKTVAEFKQLKQAGLSRIHIGMESGSNEVLALIHKGVAANDHIKAGLNIRESGIELSEYFMPGLGGVQWTREHALETACVLNAINPDFIRLRTFHAVPGTGMDNLIKKGEFQPLSDEDIIGEIKLFIKNLEVQGTVLMSDHILNLLEEVEGRLPEDKLRLLSVIERYFALPQQERLIYRLGRRSGALRRLDDLADRESYLRLQGMADSIAAEGSDLDTHINTMMNYYI